MAEGNVVVPFYSNCAPATLRAETGTTIPLSYLTNYNGRGNLTQGLILSSSFDWSIKLWSHATTEKGLMTFMAHDNIVSDVQWNSMHAAKFASCGADGKLMIWNLLKSTVLPAFVHHSVGVAITKCSWNADGKHLAFGDSEGKISILKQKTAANSYTEEMEKTFKEKINAILSK